MHVQEKLLGREKEIIRVLGCNKHDHLQILNVLPNDVASLAVAAKNAFRHLSVSVHPDKLSHPSSAEAFARVRKAHQVLTSIDESSSDYTERQMLLDIYRSANGSASKVSCILDREHELKDSDDRYYQHQAAKQIQMCNETNARRALQREQDVKWQDSRDHRVQSWRQYSAKVGKNQRKRKTNTKKMRVLA